MIFNLDIWHAGSSGADLCSRRALQSASTWSLGGPCHKRSAVTVGGGTFQVSGSRIWNELPEDVATAPITDNLPASTEDLPVPEIIS